MIKKISREEIETLIKEHYNITSVAYYRDYGSEGYGVDYSCDYEFVEGEEKQ